MIKVNREVIEFRKIDLLGALGNVPLLYVPS